MLDCLKYSFLYVTLVAIPYYIFCLINAADYQGAPIIGFWSWLLHFIKWVAIITMWLIITFLILTFIAWLIVLFIVPEIIVIFIFFIPVPIPLKRLILLFVPPFFDLTITGVLPFMLFFLFAPMLGSIALLGICVYVIEEYIRTFQETVKQLFPFDPHQDLSEFFDNPSEKLDEGVIQGNDLSNHVLTSINPNNSNIYVYDPSTVDDNMNNYYNNVLNLIKKQTHNCILGDSSAEESYKNKISFNSCKVKETLDIFNLNYTMNEKLIKSQTQK
jgi:hypothetical protein